MDSHNGNQNIARVRRSRGYTPLLLILSIFLLALSVYCIIHAYSAGLTGVNAAIFYAAGGIGALFFAYSTFDYLFQTVSPKNAILISDKGFADFTLGGTGAGFIEWSNVKSTETALSQKYGRILRIELFDSEKVIAEAEKPAAKAMRAALEGGQPVIVIRQMDLDCKVADLEKLFKGKIDQARSAAEHRQSEEECCKTRVVTDEDVKSICRKCVDDNTVTRETDPIIAAVEEAEKTDDKAEEPGEPDEPDKSDEPYKPDEPDDAAEQHDDAEPEKEENVPKANAGADAAEEEITPVYRTEEEKAADMKKIDDILARLADELKTKKRKLDDEGKKELTDELNSILEEIKKNKSGS